MIKQVIKIKKIREKAIIPKRATEGSAGIDLSACIDEAIELYPSELIRIPTGIAIELPSTGYAALVFARSGLGTKHGICLSNGVGVIDSDYTGEIIVGLCNVSNKVYKIMPFERIAQLVVVPVSIMPIIETDELKKTERGDKGFGSSGKY